MEKYNLEVWDITFYKTDEDGEPLVNEDGSVKLFQDKKCSLDWSDRIHWILDAIDKNENLLEEIIDKKILESLQ
jgi:hypothetical protein